QAGPAGGSQPLLSATNLIIPGLATPRGNAVSFGGNGTSARFNLATNIKTGPIYFSFALNVPDLSGLTSNGLFWAAFNNSSGTQTTTPTNTAARVVVRAASTGFNLGLD